MWWAGMGTGRHGVDRGVKCMHYACFGRERRDYESCMRVRYEQDINVCMWLCMVWAQEVSMSKLSYMFMFYFCCQLGLGRGSESVIRPDPPHLFIEYF